MPEQKEKESKEIFPPPLHVPARLEHRQTFIILHGRGSNAHKFSGPLLSTPTLNGKQTLPEAFPHARFIFPTATLNRARAFNRSIIHQWFDVWDLENNPHQRNELMIDGLRKSTSYIHRLLEAEVAKVGEENVILWGLSQGCAAALASLLLWNGRPFAAVIGMCGWLPFSNILREIVVDGGPDDIFQRAEENVNVEVGSTSASDLQSLGRPGGLHNDAINFLREELGADKITTLDFQRVPIFLGHGSKDDKVPIERCKEAVECLQLLQLDVRMVEYEDLGHWYSEAMLEDTVCFLKESLK